jgi:hypothetical protein
VHGDITGANSLTTPSPYNDELSIQVLALGVIERGHCAYCHHRAAYEDILRMQGWTHHKHLTCRRIENYPDFLVLNSHY